MFADAGIELDSDVAALRAAKFGAVISDGVGVDDAAARAREARFGAVPAAATGRHAASGASGGAVLGGTCDARSAEELELRAKRFNALM
jgi:hypothetical protein